jgi:hypothetical protein
MIDRSMVKAAYAGGRIDRLTFSAPPRRRANRFLLRAFA